MTAYTLLDGVNGIIKNGPRKIAQAEAKAAAKIAKLQHFWYSYEVIEWVAQKYNCSPQEVVATIELLDDSPHKAALLASWQEFLTKPPRVSILDQLIARVEAAKLAALKEYDEDPARKEYAAAMR